MKALIPAEIEQVLYIMGLQEGKYSTVLNGYGQEQSHSSICYRDSHLEFSMFITITIFPKPTRDLVLLQTAVTSLYLCTGTFLARGGEEEQAVWF